jgi:hypothetical protein
VELEGRKVNLPIKLGVNYQLSSNIPIVIHTTFLFFWQDYMKIIYRHTCLPLNCCMLGY